MNHGAKAGLSVATVRVPASWVCIVSGVQDGAAEVVPPLGEPLGEPPAGVVPPPSSPPPLLAAQPARTSAADGGRGEGGDPSHHPASYDVLRSLRIRRLANRPGEPITQPPGCVPDPHW